ncbi:hypothetical protein GGF41_001107 [Coemansia sp. RSA 2531]|nr:hypothetical protein GGF41_001107 [Coemansia sp. RSA 2531]
MAVQSGKVQPSKSSRDSSTVPIFAATASDVPIQERSDGAKACDSSANAASAASADHLESLCKRATISCNNRCLNPGKSATPPTTSTLAISARRVSTGTLPIHCMTASGILWWSAAGSPLKSGSAARSRIQLGNTSRPRPYRSVSIVSLVTAPVHVELDS